MSETDRKLDRIAELLEEQMRSGSNRTSSRGPSVDSSGGSDFFKNLKDAGEPFKQSLKDFDRALSDSNTSLHTFSKYTYAADNGLAAITKLATGLPYLSKAIAAVGTAFSGLLGAVFKQTDELLQASDQFAKIGAAGSLTTKQIMEMGEKAGLTTKDLGILTNATSKIGTGLIGLGGNVTKGITEFADMANVSKDVRQEFQRMGVSQSELIDQMANYVALQAASGKSMVTQAKDAATLKKSSLEYSENLLRLSALTGKSADVLQEEQKQQAMELEELIAKRQEDDKIRELRKSGANAEADAIEKEQKNRVAFITDMSAKYGKATGVALGKVARTGSYDQTTVGYANIGLDAGKIKSDLKNGVDGKELANEVGEILKAGTTTLLRNFGQGAQFNSQELFTALGFPDFKEFLLESGKRTEIKDQAQNATAVQTINDNKSLLGAASKDFAQISRNFVKETEIDLNKTKQGFIALANVFVEGPALVEENIKKAGKKFEEFVKNMLPASVIEAAKKPSNTITGALSDANKAEAVGVGAAATVAGKVGEVVTGRIPVVRTAFTILKKVGKLEVIASLIDMAGGDQIAAWLKSDTKLEDIKKLPTTIATAATTVKDNIPNAAAAVTEEVLPGPKRFENIKQGWEYLATSTNKIVKELQDLIVGISGIPSASTAPVATPAATTGRPDTSATRSHGTTGETGKEVEQKDVVAQLHAGEKVLPKEEAEIYIKDKTPVATPVAVATTVAAAPAPVAAVPAVAAPAVAAPVATASTPTAGDFARADRAAAPAEAVEAKSSTPNKSNFTIEDYVAPTTGDFARADRAAAVVEPVAPTTGDFARADRAAAVSAPAEVSTARPAISASDTLSKVTLEAVNPVVVDALKKITTSSAPEAAALASNNSNSEKMMFEVLSLFTDKCDEMIDKLEEANDIAAKILRESR